MTSKINEILKRVREFIMALEVSEELPEESNRGFFFSGVDESGEDEGFLLLTLDETRSYQACLNMLADAVDESKISRKAVESELQKTILFTLDIRNKREKISLEDRLRKAINDLQTFLTSSPEPFKVYYPVNNLDIDGLPIQVGDVQFLVYEEEIVERQLKLYREMQTDSSRKADYKAGSPVRLSPTARRINRSEENIMNG